MVPKGSCSFDFLFSPSFLSSRLAKARTKKEEKEKTPPSLSHVPSPLLVPRTDKGPHLVAAPVDPVLVPAARPRHLDEGGDDEEAEAGEGAGGAVAVLGGALFAVEGVDAIVGVLRGEGAARPHFG